jgi:glyoxylase-like metal-dependent hydrolase (beta-lactamase superfamily II)/8-oxo-dGTP pyrophosphatase MutT (NUDIX family)
VSLPLRPAASIILICREEGVTVLWVRRSEANPFLGGFHSFPGGRHAREDGSLESDSALYLRTMARCAAREMFEETGLLVGFQGEPPPLEERRRLRKEVLEGKAEFWPMAEGAWGLRFDAGSCVPCGRWITPHFSRVRFDTYFFLVETAEPLPPDVWPGELESGGWVDPREAARLWDQDQIVLAMPTLHAIRVLAEGAHGLPARLRAIPEANGIPSRHVLVRPAITMIPLRSETLPPATHTNASVIGDGDVVIVDPGSADSEELEALDRIVREALGPGGRVAAILLTHRHRDHIAGVGAARERYGAPVWAHEQVAERVPIDRALRDGDIIELPGRHLRRVRVLEAPGHARSHLVFHEVTSQTLIAGDVVSGLGTVVIDPPDGNLRDYLATLERLRGLGLKALIPGHGPPHRGVDRMLDALIEHRRLRESRVLRALAAGPMDESALRNQVYADTPGADLGLAAKTLRAHLEKLLEEGRVKMEDGKVGLTK